ncbi:hypothetical protein SK128_008135 [Halocaridina rubra]|uniref:dihydrofolate reductase n=1 Tax=Halocaridina rubra TaxID=373956 RepID=A0AAN8X640_HALRR
MALKLNLIVAACENNGIGKNGELPWRLREEMKYFSRMTKKTSDPEKKNIVLMGRKTWESIPTKFRPLPERINFILSSRPKEEFGDVNGSVICKNFEAALDEARARGNEIDTVWVIGGSSVYQLALESEFLHRIYLTRILQSIECDTFLPDIDTENRFKLVLGEGVSQEIQEENGIQYKYLIYEKL